MAAGAWTVYSNAALEMSKALIDLSSATFVLTLFTTSYTPNVSTNKQWSDISANEVATGGGYTAGGVALTSVTDTLTGDTVTFTSAAATWATFTATFRYGVLVKRAGGSIANSDLLLCYSDLGGGSSITGGGGTLTVTMNASGIFTITHSP